MGKADCKGIFKKHEGFYRESDGTFVVVVVVPRDHAFFKITELKSESQNQMSKFLSA